MKTIAAITLAFLAFSAMAGDGPCIQTTPDLPKFTHSDTWETGKTKLIKAGFAYVPDSHRCMNASAFRGCYGKFTTQSGATIEISFPHSHRTPPYITDCPRSMRDP